MWCVCQFVFVIVPVWFFALEGSVFCVFIMFCSSPQSPRRRFSSGE